MSKRYYERNAEKLRERFKRRYRSDPEFRKAHQERVRAYKKKRSKEKGRIKTSTTERKTWRIFNVSGTKVECCRIGHLAVHLGRSVQTVRLWEKEGTFPKSIIYKGHRYYTRPHFDMILRMWNRHNEDLQKFFVEVRTQWNIINQSFKGDPHGKDEGQAEQRHEGGDA